MCSAVDPRPYVMYVKQGGYTKAIQDFQAVALKGVIKVSLQNMT